MASVITITSTATAPLQAIGFVSTFGTYSIWNCLTGAWYQVSGFGRCCHTTTDCPVYTTCLEGSIVANDQFRYTCSGSSSQTVCVTGTVYQSIGDRSPRYYLGCWPSWTGGRWDATRKVPITTTQEITPTSIPPTSLTPTPTPTPTPTAPIPAASTPAQSSGKSSGAFPPGTIAAMVLSIVIGLAIAVSLGFLISCLWNRRERKRAAGRAQLEAAAQKDVQALVVQPVQPPRPQSGPAELEEPIEAIAETDGQEISARDSRSASEAYVPGHRRRPSEVDGREVRRPSEVAGKEVRRPSEVGGKEVRRPPKVDSNGEAYELDELVNGNIQGKAVERGEGERQEEEEGGGNGEGSSNAAAPNNNTVPKDELVKEDVADLRLEAGQSNIQDTGEDHTLVKDTTVANGKQPVR